MNKRLLIYCVGDQAHGLGHVQRCLVLARELTQIGVQPVIVTSLDTPGAERVQRQADEFVLLDGDFGEYIHRTHRDYGALLVDLEHGPPRELLEMARPLFPFIANVGGIGFQQSDPEAVRRLVDLEIYQGELFDQPASARALNGPEYLIVDPRYRQCAPDYDHGPLVIACGGGDPHRLTERLVIELAPLSYPLRVVIGAARGPLYRPAQGEFRPKTAVTFFEAPPDLVDVFQGASLAVLQFGMTAYESLCAGVPTVLYNLTHDHERTAIQLLLRGCAINLGLWSEINWAQLPYQIDRLKNHVARLEHMGHIGRSLIDGRGARRVAEAIWQARP